MKMEDSKEIEELRALAFASIPTVARKAVTSAGSSLKGKRRRISVDTEEGEILSDEDSATATATATATSRITLERLMKKIEPCLGSISGSLLIEGVSDVPAKQKGIAMVSMEVATPVSTATPSFVSSQCAREVLSREVAAPVSTTTPSFFSSQPLAFRSEENCNLIERASSIGTASRDENTAVKMVPTPKNDVAKSIEYSKMGNAPRPSRTVTGPLPSKIPLAPMLTGGIRKEADAFLASLNIPATANPSHLGERNNSLVIKFSDDDSDSDGEQDAQVGKNRFKNRKRNANEPSMSSSLGGGHRMALASQSTAGLKSEIDRVKKQIAAIERAKGMVGALPASRFSKVIALEVPLQQSNSKLGVSTSRPVDLENLRLQIAAKESELRRRKERGPKESLNNGNALVSSWSMDALGLTQVAEKSEGESQGAEVLVDEAPEFQGNASPEINESLTKMEGLESKREQLHSMCDKAPTLGIMRCSSSSALKSQIPGVSSDSVVLASLNATEVVEPVASKTKFVLEGCDLTLLGRKRNDTSRNKASSTPKRKRQEPEWSDKFNLTALKSEGTKKQKRDAFFAVLANRARSKELNIGASSAPSSDVVIAKVFDENLQPSQSSESKENSIFMQGMPQVAVPTVTSPQRNVDEQMESTTEGHNASDGVDATLACDEERESACIIHEPLPDLSHENVEEVVGKKEILPRIIEPSPLQNDIADTCKCRGTSTNVAGKKEILLRIIEPSPLQNDIADTSKCRGTSTNVAFSPPASPSRAIIETQGNPGILSDEQKEFQRILVGASTTCSSLPVWAYSSQLQEVSDQRLEYGQETLWQLQEEEDVIDKELEEAQQNRRRCEVREHFARRQYRDAQEALHSANLQCEMLFHKREMLSARVKAAQLRLHSNKSSLVSQYGEAALLSLGSSSYSERASFRLGTSFWARDDGEAGNLPPLNQEHDGFDTDFATVQNQHRGSLRFQSPKPGEKPVVFDSSATKPMVTQTDAIIKSPGVCTVKGDVTIGKVFEGSAPLLLGVKTITVFPEEPVSSQSPSTGPVRKDFSVDFVPQVDNGVEKVSVAEKSRLTVSTLVESNQDCGFGKEAKARHARSIEKECHHGFSSASFAMDLERDANSNVENPLEKINSVTQRQEAFTKQCNSSSQPVHLVSEGISFNMEQTPDDRNTNFFSVANSIGICAPKNFVNNEYGPCPAEVLAVEKSSEQNDGPTEFLAVEKSSEQNYGKATSKQTDTDISTANSCPTKSPQSADVRCDKSLHKQMEKTSIETDEWQKGLMSIKSDAQKVEPFGTSDGMPELLSSRLPLVLARNSEAELEMAPVVSVEHVTNEKDVGSSICFEHTTNEKDIASFTCFVPSASFKLLFSYAPDPDVTLDTSEQQNLPDGLDLVMPERYGSPLCVFRSYTATLQPWYDIDPHKPLCKYEHRGKCKNDECLWQHKRDYTLSVSHILNQDVSDHVLKSKEVTEGTGKKGFSYTLKKLSSPDRGEKNEVEHVAFKKSNVWVAKVPVYSVGSYLTKTQYFEPFLSCMTHNRQSIAGQPFLALHRQVPMDMPCLLQKPPTLDDGSIFSRQLLMDDRSWIEDEGLNSGTLEDTESLLEAALELFNFDLKIQKSEVRRSVLYLLSRGLEANPYSVAMWVVYLHLFYRWEKGASKDDLFQIAVQYNSESYELWMMYIRSRSHLMDKLEAFESAMISLGSKVELEGLPSDRRSSLLLDLALQKLNCMCTSGLVQEAARWINSLTSLATENVEASGMNTASSSLILLTCLAKPDLCILWISCAYVFLQGQLPSNVIESLGCKQQLLFQNIWGNTRHRRSSCGQAMRVMRIAASQGKGCLALDSLESSLGKDFQLLKEVFTANFVQCAAVCEGLDCSLTIAKKYFDLFSPSVELTLLIAQLEEHHKGKMASLEIFEKALGRWPLQQSGKLRLWNQYIGYAFEAKGLDFVNVLLSRCAKEIYESDNCGSVAKSLNSSFPPILNNMIKVKECQQKTSQVSVGESNNGIGKAFQLVPSLVKRQLTKDSGFHGQLFSYQDAVFGYLNLAFSEALDGRSDSARKALHSSMNFASDAESMGQCLRELAAFSCSGLTLSFPSRSHFFLRLLNRCILESQFLDSQHSLSRWFCESIRKRRVRLFVDSLLGPWPSGFSFLNPILETIYGPTLLPKETMAVKDLLEFSEKMLEILPSNVRLAISICRAVQSRAFDGDGSTGFATMFWCTSLLVDSLCQASPEAPEFRWVEAGEFVKLLEIDTLLEDFYWLALRVHPFSASLWQGLLAVSKKTGNSASAIESAMEKGVKLDQQIISF